MARPASSLKGGTIIFYTPLIDQRGITWERNEAPGYECQGCRLPSLLEEAQRFGKLTVCLNCYDEIMRERAEEERF